MDSLNEMCCLCLSKSNASFNDIRSKSADNLTYFCKISSLSQIVTVMETNIDYMLCNNCCDTVNMIYNFRKRCLQSLKSYNFSIKQLKENLEYKVAQPIVEVKNIENVNVTTEILNNTDNIETNSILRKILEKNSNTPSSVTIKQEVDDFSNSDQRETLDIIDNSSVKEEADIGIKYSDESEKISVLNEDTSLSTKVEDCSPREEATESTLLMANEKKPKRKRRRLVDDEEKTHICNICEKSFTTKKILVNHLHIHTMKKTHLCEICGKSFLRKADLAAHRVIHSNEKPFTCDVCNKSFKLSKVLKMHKRVHTGEKYHCDICNKYFTYCSQLTIHNRLHKGEKKLYFCEVCNKSFVCSKHFKKHKLNHTMRKDYMVWDGDQVRLEKKN